MIELEVVNGYPEEFEPKFNKINILDLRQENQRLRARIDLAENRYVELLAVNQRLRRLLGWSYKWMMKITVDGGVDVPDQKFHMLLDRIREELSDE